jgi:uncharacterized protein
VPSLHEIEKTVATLWLNRQARQWLLSGRKGPMPKVLADAPAEVLRAVDRKGVDLYADLMAFGHHDVMESVYPFTSSLLGEKKWHSVVEDYLLRFPPDHFNFNRLCDKLSQYFTIYGGTLVEKYPFLPELADYEWIELEKMEEDVDIISHPHEQLATPEQIATLAPVVNPTLTVRDYKYNVLAIGDAVKENRKLGKVKPERTLVACFRHPETHVGKFAEIGEAAAKIVEMVRHQSMSYSSLIPVVVSLTPGLAPEESVTEFLELVEDLQELGIFVGSRKVGA